MPSVGNNLNNEDNKWAKVQLIHDGDDDYDDDDDDTSMHRQQGAYTPGHLKCKAIQDFSRLLKNIKTVLITCTFKRS